jgi:hypothetical protein
VITNTGGSALDPDGYPFQLDNDSYSVGVNDEPTVALLPGQHSLELTEVAIT